VESYSEFKNKEYIYLSLMPTASTTSTPAPGNTIIARVTFIPANKVVYKPSLFWCLLELYISAWRQQLTGLVCEFWESHSSASACSVQTLADSAIDAELRLKPPLRSSSTSRTVLCH
jgi:hypothetical protein